MSGVKTSRRARAPRRGALLGLVLALGTAAAGCGSTHVVGRHRTVGIALTEYRLAPDSIRARPGLLTIFVHNYGRRTHNLVVSLDGHAIGATKPLWPGQRDKITLALIPGRYVIASTILNDQALGDYGTLVVP
jgi:hypothetical protein